MRLSDQQERRGESQTYVVHAEADKNRDAHSFYRTDGPTQSDYHEGEQREIDKEDRERSNEGNAQKPCKYHEA